MREREKEEEEETGWRGTTDGEILIREGGLVGEGRMRARGRRWQ